MESSIGILFKGYPYFKEQFEKQETDVFHTRLLFQKTTVLKGEEAAEIFYDTKKFIRSGAAPKRIQKTLFGEGGVQGLDHEKHRHRKDMFMKVMSRESIERLQNSFKKYWSFYLRDWERKDDVNLFSETQEILCLAACEWIGVPLNKKEVKKRTKHFSRMIDASGGIGIRHRKGRVARKKAEKWISKLVKQERKKKDQNGNDSILNLFSSHRNLEGKLLDKKIVAVEIINLIRPIVAIARYIVFSALALHDYPQYKERLQQEKDNLDLCFVQEVRRFYPFFPFVAAIVDKSFDWQGEHFPKGRKVLLDLYATNHDYRIWKNPDSFYAERFLNWNGSAFNFIPQGGGDHHTNHRCAGEWITIDLTRIAIDFLINRMEYMVPEQDLQIDMARIPAIPESRFKIENIRRIK